MSENIKEIIEKAKRGDKESFSELYSVYFTPLYRYVRLRIGDKAESDDLVQDIFIKSYNSVEKISLPRLSPLAYFYSIARNSVRSWKRKRKNFNMSDYASENYPTGKFNWEDGETEIREFEDILRSMRGLSDDQADAVIFKFVDDLSKEEIAVILDKSEEIVQELEVSGIKTIRDFLKKQYER